VPLQQYVENGIKSSLKVFHSKLLTVACKNKNGFNYCFNTLKLHYFNKIFILLILVVL